MEQTIKNKSQQFYLSPLRYPGGKAFLASEFERIIEAMGLNEPTYVEPYAGGAGAALALLFDSKVKKIVINDLDKAIYAFWFSVVNKPETFARKILTTPITISEWRKQKKIYFDENAKDFDRGFATFFLNRTNRSGVMNAGPIGGQDQTGSYKIDVRFNKKDLVSRIRKIGKRSKDIIVLNKDGIELTKKYINRPNTFIYLDPPYFKKGAMLYMNHYMGTDHKDLATLLNANAGADWVLTYDWTQPILNLYKKRDRKRLDLKYRVHDSLKSRNAREVMIFSDSASR